MEEAEMADGFQNSAGGSVEELGPNRDAPGLFQRHDSGRDSGQRYFPIPPATSTLAPVM